jgi:hypothetical protein
MLQQTRDWLTLFAPGPSSPEPSTCVERAGVEHALCQFDIQEGRGRGQ